MKQSNHWSRSLTILSLCAVCVMAAVAWKTASARGTELVMMAAAKPTAVAVVDFEKVLKVSKEFTDGMDYLKLQEREAQVKIDELKVKFEKIKTDLAAMKDAATLDRLKRTQEALVTEAQLTALVQTSQRILEVQGGDLMRQVFEKMVEASKTLQKQDGWDLILIDDRRITPPEKMLDAEGKESSRLTLDQVHSIIQRRHILAAVERVDITQTLVEYMNSQYGKAAKK